MDEEIKTTTKEEYGKKIQEQKMWDNIVEQLKQYHEFVNKKTLKK